MRKNRTAPERLRFLYNGVELYTSNSYPHIPISKIVSEVFSHTSKLELWSNDALANFAIGSLELIRIYCVALLKEAKHKGKIRALMRKIDGYLKIFPKLNRDQMLSAIYNLTLSCENLGTLPNFRIRNKWGDVTNMNPEKTSIYKENM